METNRKEYWVSDLTKHPEGLEYYAGKWNLYGKVNRCGCDTGKPYLTFKGANRSREKMQGNNYHVVTFELGEPIIVTR